MKRSTEDISVENKKKKTQPLGEDDTTPLDLSEYDEAIDLYTQENTNRIDGVNHAASINTSLFTFVYNSGIEWINHHFGWNRNEDDVLSSENENYESNRMENEVLTYLETNEYQSHGESSPSVIMQSREDNHDHYFIQIDLRYQFRRFATPTVRNTVRTQCASLVHEHMTSIGCDPRPHLRNKKTNYELWQIDGENVFSTRDFEWNMCQSLCARLSPLQCSGLHYVKCHLGVIKDNTYTYIMVRLETQ
jgi:hypothetical protein